MKSAKFVSDVALGISLVLFSYIYWTVYRIDSGSLNSWSTDEITNVSVNLFYVALLLSIISIMFRSIVIKQEENKKGLNWSLLTIATIPLVKWLLDMFAYAGS